MCRQAKVVLSAAIAMQLPPENGRFKSLYSTGEKLGITTDAKQTVLLRPQMVAELAALIRAHMEWCFSS